MDLLSNKKIIKISILVILVIVIGTGIGYGIANAVAEKNKQYCVIVDKYKTVGAVSEPNYLGKYIFDVTNKNKMLIINRANFGQPSVGIMIKDTKIKDETGNFRYQLKSGDKFKIVSSTSLANDSKNYKVIIENQDGTTSSAIINELIFKPIAYGEWLRIRTDEGKIGWVQKERVKELTDAKSK